MLTWHGMHTSVLILMYVSNRLVPLVPTAQLGIGPEPDKAEGWAKTISAKVKELFGLPSSWRPKGHRVRKETTAVFLPLLIDRPYTKPSIFSQSLTRFDRLIDRPSTKTGIFSQKINAV